MINDVDTEDENFCYSETLLSWSVIISVMDCWLEQRKEKFRGFDALTLFIKSRFGPHRRSNSAKSDHLEKGSGDCSNGIKRMQYAVV